MINHCWSVVRIRSDSDLFYVWICSDLFGCVRMCSNSSIFTIHYLLLVVISYSLSFIMDHLVSILHHLLFILHYLAFAIKFYHFWPLSSAVREKEAVWWTAQDEGLQKKEIGPLFYEIFGVPTDLQLPLMSLPEWLCLILPSKCVRRNS